MENMSKKFIEVFPTLKMTGEMDSLMKNTEVYRVSVSKDKSVFSIYFKSKYLIPKKAIRRLEKDLAKQLFPGTGVVFRIFESFELSEGYTAQHLYEEYGESIENEICDYNPVMGRILKKAEFSFQDNELELGIEDNIISHSMEAELVRILEKIFSERCSIPIIIKIKYLEKKPSKTLEMAEYRAKSEAEAIISRAYGMAVNEAGTDDAPAVKEAPVSLNYADGKKRTLSRSGKNSFRNDALKRGDDPDLLYGRGFEDEAVSINDIDGPIGETCIKGRIIYFEEKSIKNERTIAIFNVTDYTNTIGVKVFLKNEQLKEFKQGVHEGAFVKIKGNCENDPFDHELSISRIYGIKSIPDFTVKRQDNNPYKRVELHLHTKMSEMDGVSEVKDLIKCAKGWGHPAMAITDHGVVQAFTDANHAIKPSDPFKLIYGVEGYLVDDEKQMVENSKGQELSDIFVVFDIETTGFSPKKDAIIEIGAVKIYKGEVVDRFSVFVNPLRPIPYRIVELTGIDDSMVKDADTIDKVLPQFLEFVGDAVLVGHNVGFDVSFIVENAVKLGYDTDFTVVDTLGMSRLLITSIAKFKLDNVAKALGVVLNNHHRAVDDAECTANIFLKLCSRLLEMGVENLDGLNKLSENSENLIKKMPSFHVIILAKNETGRVNLYRLVSEGHLKYFHRAPRIPKTLLNKYREGLIVGSACEAGELFRAILEEKDDAEIARIVNFYDYLEIQPIGNNEFLKREGRVETDEDLRDFNRRIVKLGEQFNKPVCATCDVHFLNPEDEVYRRIIMAGKGFKDADDQAPLYLRTTDEMLEEFAYLGSDKAFEVVVTNTNLIADQIDKIPPVRPDKCAPVIENSDQTLTDICYKRAKEIYGEELPVVVKERLDRELKSIITNGFAVMYIIAQKLVWKSNEDGYLVGSRGSVGSSFVAFLSGITEVNSLAPHYYCSKCHFTDFDSEEVKKFSGMAGCDMPDRICPVCGEKLNKDGFDIPFETFLGFKGDKEPDIDLNFSGDYQAKAHKYTEVIFGAGCTFKAGTVGTVADKTAYGYVYKYFEERGISKRRCEMERISVGCTGIKRTTGQHPGGIIVLPHGEEINTFTPVQHPANDETKGVTTTHFDYHSIDHNLLKLDILGHDDPTMIRFLQDLTGVDPKTIPLDDKGVMSLFQDMSALKLNPGDLGNVQLGALGIPEFGTPFAMGMLLQTKPQYFSDLVRIAGLSHGTDVWLGNAQTLIEEGKATISTAICTRDDIMIYLISMGIDPSKAFKIMEMVRKGKVAGGKCDAWPEWKQDMIDHNVPDWYIWSCEKIQYMFPKAHAAAYVMMAWRIAWFKIYEPLAYYAAYFSIRAKGFSYELMCLGKEALEANLADYKARSDKKETSNKEEDQLSDMLLVQEMYARGFEFWQIDLKKADAKYFKIIDGKLMPSLSSIDGVGENAADSIAQATKNGDFLSKDDFRERTHASNTIIELLDRLHLLGDIPESNQLSLFDVSSFGFR